MKIAITGKGGVGKSTFAGILAHLAAAEGNSVLAVDADPDANLAFALGIPEEERKKIVPISQRTELIEQRTGAKAGQFGQLFKLNPKISDVTDRFGHDFRGVQLLVLGAIESGGSGCACPESVFLRSLLANIILQRDEFVIVDMEAGIEHLGRATAQGVDLMIVVVEPTPQSAATALAVVELAGQMGLVQVRYVANKIASASDLEYVGQLLEAGNVIGSIPYSNRVLEIEKKGLPLIDNLEGPVREAFNETFKNIQVLSNDAPREVTA